MARTTTCRIAFVVCAVVAGCGKSSDNKAAPDDAPSDDRTKTPAARSDGGGAAAPTGPAKSFATRIDSRPTFDKFATKPGGIVRSGAVIKFLIDNRDYPGKTPTVYYINGNFTDGGDKPAEWARLHRTWAIKEIDGFDLSLKKFSKTAYFTKSLAQRQWISGRIQTFEKDGKVFLGAWFIEMDLIHEEMIQFAMEQLLRTFVVPGEPLAFVAYSDHQTTSSLGPWLEKTGVAVHRLADLLAGVEHRSLNPGDAWGYVRFAPADADALSPTDIPVFDVLPLDLAVVAGTITTAFQDVASHVNIKAKQRGTPNLMVLDKATIARLRSLDGKPIHLSVTTNGYTIEPSTAETVKNKLAALLAGQKWKTAPADTTGAPVSYDMMCVDGAPADCLALAPRYGGKAASLGFLAHAAVAGVGSPIQNKVGYRLTPLGFAIPISSYREFIAHASAADPSLGKDLARLIRTERAAPVPAAEQRALVAAIQAKMRKAPFPAPLYRKIESQVRALKSAYGAQFPGETLTTIKIRSSANVEDIPKFNGAGLHNSFSAKLAASNAATINAPCALAGKRQGKVEPRSLACAIKATYASLWNLRAVRERSFRRFDHRGAYMGLAVVPSYKHKKGSKRGKIAANSVLLTRVLNTETVYGYQLSTQKGNNLVTNPKPGTLAELTTLTFQLASTPAPTVLQYAKPKRKKPIRTKPVLSVATMRRIVAIGRAIEEAYCRAKPTYFVVDGKQRKCHQISNSWSKPSALDMELKIYANGDVLFKQAREFDGR